MLEFGACPQCKMDISPERKKLVPVVCDHCGFTVSNSNEVVESELYKKTNIIMGGVCVFVLASYMLLMDWDKHALNIIPLTIKGTIGMSGPADAEQKAEICMDLKKWECVEEQYAKTAQVDPQKWIRAGDFLMKRAKYNEAAQAYYKFFQSGGQDLQVSYNYAKALAQLGQVDEAVKYFDQVLAARPDVLQITVVHNYVKLLVAHKRFDQAKVLIENVRKTGGESANSFMENEYKEITSMSTASRE